MDCERLSLKTIDVKKYKKILKNYDIMIPVWIDPDTIQCYEKKEIIMVELDDEPLAFYIIPYYKKDNNIWAERKFRYFAYLSPLFVRNCPNKKRKEAIYLIFKYIFDKYDYMYMPMHPSFNEISSIQGLGAFIECRHTHILKNVMDLNKLDGKLRNNIRSAAKKLKIKIGYDPSIFNFDVAIHGTEEERKRRKQHALNLLKKHKAIIFTGYLDDQPIIGNMVTFDKEWLYGLHAWQIDKVPRGSGPFIIYSISKWAFEIQKVKYFDFEGSVMQSIDDYFCNFNVEQIIYPYIHYGKNKKNMLKLIDISHDIKGRLYNEK